MPTTAERWPIPTPLPVGAINTYRLEGPKPTLIDCGPRTPEALVTLRGRLAQHPCRVLVLTHEHSDHAGLARALQKDDGMEVWVHRREKETLERWTEEALAREIDYERGLKAAGVPPELGEYMRYGGRKYSAWSESVRADRVFEGGETIALGGHEFEVVDAPGHTPGSCLLTDGTETFSGDTLLETITPNALSVRETERSGLVDYLETLRRLENREWGLVLPGHGRPFLGAGDVVRLGLLHAQRRRERLLRELSGPADSAWGNVQRLFPRLPDSQAFLAVSEVLGHLEALRREGRVGVERVDGVDRYGLRA